MAGMLFVVCVPTAEKEYEMVNGLPPPPGRGPLVNLDGPAVARVDPLQSRGPGTRKINPDTVPMERVSARLHLPQLRATVLRSFSYVDYALLLTCYITHELIRNYALNMHK